jgi:mannosyl-3-phosphoglycerate phosphatase
VDQPDRRAGADGPAETAAPLLVVTDLDGTLLDEETYAFDAARAALDALAGRGVPLVLASSKTGREMQALSEALGVDCVLIVENGGAVIVPAPRGSAGAGALEPDVELVLGVDRRVLVEQLADMARATGVAVRGFSSCSVDEIARLTGLTRGEAEAASDRRYDEPFLAGDPGEVARLVGAASARGVRITRGGRFFHLSGPTDKGTALRALLGHWRTQGRTFSTVGLGDAPNDGPLLRAVDRPIIVPRPGGSPDADLAALVPEAEIAPCPGPAGWNAAVLAVLGGQRLPRVSGGPR